MLLAWRHAAQAPQGYCLLWEDGEMMKDRAFYVPGTRSESWNTVTPPVRVYVRNDCYDRVHPPPSLPAPRLCQVLQSPGRPAQLLIVCAMTAYMRCPDLNAGISALSPLSGAAKLWQACSTGPPRCKGAALARVTCRLAPNAHG